MLYDNTWARELYSPGDSNCTGPQGYQVCPVRLPRDWPRLWAKRASLVRPSIQRLQRTCDRTTAAVWVVTRRR